MKKKKNGPEKKVFKQPIRIPIEMKKGETEIKKDMNSNINKKNIKKKNSNKSKKDNNIEKKIRKYFRNK